MLLKEKLVCTIPSYSPLIRPRPALDTGKVSSHPRQWSSNAADVHLPPAGLKKAWMLPSATQRPRSIKRILLVDPVAPVKNQQLPPSSVLTTVFGVVTFSSAYPAETALRQIIIMGELSIQWQNLVTSACYTHPVLAVEMQNGVTRKV